MPTVICVDEPDDFAPLVETALATIPPEFVRYLENVSILVEDEPSPALLRRMGLDPRRDTLFGLYQGVPLPHRGHDYGNRLPDQITIFRGPLCRACRTRDELALQVQRTVVHEIAHFFGLDEHRIRRLGY
jgi:predicted Zn-dependent protease with MMP-like domain